jgi:putative acetyltransferase
MTGPVVIRPERPGDRDAIFAVHRAAFGQEAEAALVDRLRADGDLVLSLVAMDGEDLVGHVAFSRLAVQAGRAAALAPVGVVPARRRQGIAAALIREGLARLTEDGQDLVLVLGEPAYYGRFGFTAEAATPLETPYAGPYQQALALTERGRGMAGDIRYAAAFAELG